MNFPQIALIKNTADKRGILKLMEKIADGPDLSGENQRALNRLACTQPLRRRQAVSAVSV